MGLLHLAHLQGQMEAQGGWGLPGGTRSAQHPQSQVAMCLTSLADDSHV